MNRRSISEAEQRTLERNMEGLRAELLSAAERFPELDTLLLRAEAALEIYESLRQQGRPEVSWNHHEWGEDFRCEDCGAHFNPDGEDDWTQHHARGCRLEVHDRLMLLAGPEADPQLNTPPTARATATQAAASKAAASKAAAGTPASDSETRLRRSGLERTLRTIPLPEGLPPEELQHLAQAEFGPFGQAFVAQASKRIRAGRCYSSAESAQANEQALKFRLKQSGEQLTFPDDLPVTRAGTLSLLCGGDWQWTEAEVLAQRAAISSQAKDPDKGTP